MSSHFSCVADIFAITNLSCSKIWVWKASKIGEILKVKCSTVINVSRPNSLLLTSGWLVTGEVGLLRFFPVEGNTKRSKELRDKEISIQLPESAKKSPIIELHFITNDCIIAVTEDSEGSLFAINLVGTFKVLKLEHPFGKLNNLSVMTRPASRLDETTISASLFVVVDGHSVYVLPLKNMLKALESEEDIQKLYLTPTKAIFSEHQVNALVTSTTDYIFIASQNQLTLYFLSTIS